MNEFPVRFGMMSAGIWQSVAVIREPLSFLFRNAWRARRISPFAFAPYRGFSTGPMLRKDAREAENLYVSLTGGHRIERSKRLLLRLYGSRLCQVAREPDSGRMVGLGLYYLNARDRSMAIIHEGYIGLHAQARGTGLGAFMRKRALRHFAACGMSQMSSRVSSSNVQSLKGNLALGFVPKEIYFDPVLSEERYYLICDLDQYRS